MEVGYRVRTDLQGRGYATEAAAACRDHARDALHAERLVAIIRPTTTRPNGWRRRSASLRTHGDLPLWPTRPHPRHAAVTASRPNPARSSARVAARETEPRRE
ncbi:GNAT family N-acetyltransferase [Streptomyces stelliscabiei]|uniref:GNAT family N-acetyltransferase n=1 Tax=Streptomyces stelliscabiei TaxID=146820 RepID=UPI003A8FE6AF